MEISVSEQALDFLLSCLLGAGLGVLYDCFRILRLSIPHGRFLAIIEDILFFILVAVSTFFFFLAHSEGQIRLYILLGEILGFIVYYFTIGILVFNASRFIVNIIKRIFRFLYRIFIAPFIRLFRFISQKTILFFVKNKLKCKKRKVFLKYHLHKKQALLYNQNSYKNRSTDILENTESKNKIKKKDKKKWLKKKRGK